MSEKTYTGWLAPDGTFFPCELYEHISTAYELLDRLHLESDTEKDLFAPDNVLLDRGWIHISLSLMGQREWQIFGKKGATEEQKVFLRPYFDLERAFPVNRDCCLFLRENLGSQ